MMRSDLNFPFLPVALSDARSPVPAERRGPPKGVVGLPLALLACMAPTTHAQQATDPLAPVPTQPAAASARSTTDDGSPVTLNALQVVAGAGGARMASIRPTGANDYVLDRADMKSALPGNNALSLLKGVPGASYSASDPLGLDISAASLFVRGFRMNEMSVVFEGIPLNDSGFLSLTGTSVVNVGVPDGIGAIAISPGAAKESTFSNSANGGGLVYSLATPAEKPAASLTQSVGSNATLVTTASAQSGALGAGGPKVLVDLQKVTADKYQTGGTQRFLRGDLKAQQDVSWGDFVVFLSASHAAVWGYNNLSFDMIHRLGWKADIWYPDYARAYTMALPERADASCGAYRCGELAALIPYDTGQTTSDRLASLVHHMHLTPSLEGSIQLYRANGATSATLTDPTTPSPSGAPFSEQVQRPVVHRTGGMATLTYTLGDHTIGAGLWRERTRSSALTSWYTEPRLGQGRPLRAIGPYDIYGPAFQTANASRWQTRSQQFYVHDDYAMTDRLTLGLGFKGIDVSTTGGGIGPDRAPSGTLRVHRNVLPHASVFWSPSDRSDVFLDVAETEAGYRVAQRGNIGYTASPWTVSSQDEFDKVARRLRPEQDWNVTLGATHRLDGLTLTYDAFYSDIRHRALSVAVGSQFAQVNTVGLMPRMRIVGADLGVAMDMSSHLHLYQGVALARSAYGSDLTVADTVFPIRGKAQPGYPAVSLTSDFSATFAAWQFGATSTEYLHQPFSYQNDIDVPAFWQVNTYASYTLTSHDHATWSFRLDVSNLLDRKNIGTATIAGSPFSGDYQTLQRSAPRQVMLSVSARI
jgi:hypothetical protein